MISNIMIADTDLDMSPPPFGDDLYDSNAPALTNLVSAPTPLVEYSICRYNISRM